MPGPLDHQAAMAMGNSERAWTDFYDKHYQRRECQAGIQAMASWRSSMLSRHKQTSVPAMPSSSNDAMNQSMSSQAQAVGRSAVDRLDAAADDLVIIID